MIQTVLPRLRPEVSRTDAWPAPESGRFDLPTRVRANRTLRVGLLDVDPEKLRDVTRRVITANAWLRLVDVGLSTIRGELARRREEIAEDTLRYEAKRWADSYRRSGHRVSMPGLNEPPRRRGEEPTDYTRRRQRSLGYSAAITFSRTTRYRAARWLAAVGLNERLKDGRHMTMAEVEYAVEAELHARAIRSEFALLAPPALTAVETGTPPLGGWLALPPNRNLHYYSPQAQPEAGAPRPAKTARGPSRRRRRDPQTLQLALHVQRSIPWCSNETLGRLYPPLHPYARAGWTGPELVTRLRRTVTVIGWHVPPRLRRPAAYLNRLLDWIDIHDVPSITAAWLTWTEQRIAPDAPTCPHGEPLGNQPNPNGIAPCPQCRRAGTRQQVTPSEPP